MNIISYLIKSHILSPHLSRRNSARMKREQDKQEKELQAQKEFQVKLEEEFRRRNDAQELLRRLELEEADMIHRLRRTQELQKEVSMIFLFVLLLLLLLLIDTLCMYVCDI